MARDYWQAKAKFLEMYGYVCACCGEANPKFLTVDHVQNDGGDRRRFRSVGTMIFLKEAISNYQPNVYRILCYNCNMGRAANGGICPHKQEHPDMKAYRRST